MIAVTDVHAHMIVPEIQRAGAHAGEDWRPRVRREGEGAVVELGGREIRSMTREVADVETMLAISRRAGVERLLLSPWVPLLYLNAEPEAGLERCRIQNRALAELVAGGAGRIAALGAVPLQDPELAAGELAAVRGSGLAGVEIAASAGGDYVGDERFEPFWAAAEETGALVFIHPTTRGFSDAVFEGYYLWNSVGNPLETTIAAAQMTMSGLMERHPRLRVILAHGGGALTTLRGRLAHAHSFQPQAQAKLEESPRDSIRRFYFDTVVHDRELLSALVGWAGADRVLLGTDYPFDMADHDPVGSVRALGLQPEAEEAVLGGNAERLLSEPA